MFKHKMLFIWDFNSSSKQYRLTVRLHSRQSTFKKNQSIFYSMTCFYLKSLPRNKFQDWFKLKGFADNFNKAQMVQFFSDKTENIVGKRENTGLQHFQLSHNVVKRFGFCQGREKPVMLGKDDILFEFKALACGNYIFAQMMEMVLDVREKT